MTSKAMVYVVDDDDGVRQALAWLMRSRRLLPESFSSGDAFWEHVQQWSAEGPSEPCCVVLDVRMPGMSGLELFELLRGMPWFERMPIIFLSGHADVPVAVDAVRRGAFDFCEKPFSDNALTQRVEQGLLLSSQRLAHDLSLKMLREQVMSLTEREQDVMRLMVEGLPNKLIADRLQISTRTVEVHRAKVLDKLAVKSVVDLVHRLHAVDFFRDIKGN